MSLLLKEFTYNKARLPHIDRILGRYKAEEFIDLIKRWTDGLVGKRVLKTDLCEEAFGEDQILFSLPSNNLHIFGLDICEETVKTANIRKALNGSSHNYIRADIRNLPFHNHAFDLVLSSSTLDHFINEDDLIRSLLELKRTIKSSGIIIAAFNNRHNLNFYFLLKLGRFFGIIPYPVQFYRPSRIKEIFKNVGLSIRAEEIIVHMISPLNKILLFMRRFIDNAIVDKLAARCILFFRWLSKRQKTKHRTGWFIAFECVKNKD